MERMIDGIPANFEVHFLDSDNPRHGFRIMGMDPLVYYQFQTPVGFLSTHTIVTDARGATVVTFNWFGTSALGTLTWPGSPPRHAHMGELVMPFQPMPHSRSFLCEGPDRTVRLFWWRRRPQGDYDLYAAHEPDTLIGLFRKHRPEEVLSVGKNYATFYFSFSHGPLLLHSLLALCLNRWLDLQDGPAQ
ncbi:hypothetical protein BJV78DRAFT_1152686 [Lactifluus subvellereus]|nr:hypothetical protein BJV78DRAFT_1152686 [Lactifluus subvellereus]